MSGNYTMRRDHRGVRRRVRVRDGVEGYHASFTTECSGCTDSVDGHVVCGPYGCHECGHTGRRRWTHFVPFDMSKALRETETDTKGDPR